MNDDANTSKATVNPEEFEREVARARRFEAEAVDLRKKLDKYKDIDPDAHRGMKEDYELLRRERASGDPKKIDELIQTKTRELEHQYQQQYGKKLDEMTQDLTATRTKLLRYEVVAPAMQKAANTFLPKALPLIERDVERNCRMIEGQVVAVDDQGQPRKSNKDPRVNMMLDEYLEELAGQYDFMVASRQVSGGRNDAERRGGNNDNGRRYSPDELARMDKGQIDKIDVADLIKAFS